MLTSICIASHNEGDLLWKTVAECQIACKGLNFEIVVADDASTDDCVESMLNRFPEVPVHRFQSRRGPSPTKDAAGRMARGEILVFLDAHCKPERGAIATLARDIVETQGQAVLIPAVSALDPVKWENSHHIVGYGARLNLRKCTFDWIGLGDMERTGRYYISPNLVGCTLALSKSLYVKLLGFDQHMFEWGVEDLDFGLKSWLMGHPILHDPEAVIGHRFQERFTTYKATQERVDGNRLRMLRKSVSEDDWREWREEFRQSNLTGTWEMAWRYFSQHRGSVEVERQFLRHYGAMSAREYSQRFSLGWP